MATISNPEGRSRGMQAIRAHDYGGPEVLVLERVPRPIAADNEIAGAGARYA